MNEGAESTTSVKPVFSPHSRVTALSVTVPFSSSVFTKELRDTKAPSRSSQADYSGCYS